MTKTEYETCEICDGAGFVPCPDHGAEVDEDGWCAICEAPMDGGPAHDILCDCQPDADEWA